MVVCTECLPKIHLKCLICNSDVIKAIRIVASSARETNRAPPKFIPQLIELDRELSMSVIKEDLGSDTEQDESYQSERAGSETNQSSKSIQHATEESSEESAEAHPINLFSKRSGLK